MFISKQKYVDLDIAFNNCKRLLDECIQSKTTAMISHQETMNELQKKYDALEKKHQELIKRSPNIEQLALAFRDMEMGAGLIKIMRVDTDKIFEWGQRG